MRDRVEGGYPCPKFSLLQGKRDQLLQLSWKKQANNVRIHTAAAAANPPMVKKKEKYLSR